jgi:hypothetical protein
MDEPVVTPIVIEPAEKIPQRHYNWEELKLEFFRGPWETVIAFAKYKKWPEVIDNKGKVNLWGYVRKSTAGWAEQKRAFITEAAKNATQELMTERKDEIKKVRDRQAQIARRMQLKGLKVLDKANMETIDVETARKLLVNGLEQEREALGVNEKKGGQPSNLTQVNFNIPKTKFDAILDGTDYPRLIKYLAEIKRERARRIGAGTGTESQAEGEQGGTG